MFRLGGVKDADAVPYLRIFPDFTNSESTVLKKSVVERRIGVKTTKRLTTAAVLWSRPGREISE